MIHTPTHTYPFIKKKTVLLSLLSVVIFSGCQQLPHAHYDNSHQHQTQKQTYVMGQTNCLKKSSYARPQVSGKIIDTTHYMLITIRNGANNQDTAKTKGELCIVNKHHGSIDITAIDRLRFLEGMQPRRTN